MPFKPILPPPAAFVDICKNHQILEITNRKIDCAKVYAYKKSALPEDINTSIHIKDLKTGEIFKNERITPHCGQAKVISYHIDEVDWVQSKMKQPVLECTGFGTYDKRLQTEVVRAYTPLLPFFLEGQPVD